MLPPAELPPAKLASVQKAVHIPAGDGIPDGMLSCLHSRNRSVYSQVRTSGASSGESDSNAEDDLDDDAEMDSGEDLELDGDVQRLGAQLAQEVRTVVDKWHLAKGSLAAN